MAMNPKMTLSCYSIPIALDTLILKFTFMHFPMYHVFPFPSMLWACTHEYGPSGQICNEYKNRLRNGNVRSL